MSKISINIVTWNSMKFLPAVLRSIYDQTHKDFGVLVIDNGSNDGTLEFIRAHFPQVTILRNTHNLGFSRAHNQGIELAFALAQSRDEDIKDFFVLVTNPDIILEPDFLTNLIREAEKRPDAGSFGGKLFRAFESGSENDDGWKSEIIDSTGLLIHKTRRLEDRGTSAIDSGLFNDIEDVFGISGALCLYRGSALYDAKLGREYFDEDFFLYKEDVDLAWRLQNFGWRAVYVPAARAYHHRSLMAAEAKGFFGLLKNRRKRSSKANFYSYRNHPAVILKNDYIWNILLHAPQIALYELEKLVYVIFFEPRLLLAIPSFLLRASRFFAKRLMIMKKAKAKPEEIRAWMR